jgi:hypothetical protein
MIKGAASLTFVALCDVVVAVSRDYVYYKELQQCAYMTKNYNNVEMLASCCCHSKCDVICITEDAGD